MDRKLLSRVWIACSLGLFINGFDLYITSVAEPFFKQSFHLTPFWLGLTQAAAPLGAAIGAIFIGHLADRLGRKAMLVINFNMLVVATICSSLAWSALTLFIFRFLVGIGIGADYPICAAYLAEMAPNKSRGKLMASAMFINCLASPIGVSIAYVIFLLVPNLDAWRIMFAFGAVPAIVGLFIRARLPESFVWKIYQRNHIKHLDTKNTYHYSSLFHKKYLITTLSLCLCWFFLDISYYGIGLFTPTILNALHLTSNGNFITNTLTIVRNTLLVNLFVAIGAFLSISVIDKMPLVKLQQLGFLGAFVGLFIIGISSTMQNSISLMIIFSGFILFNVFANLGPGITTYLLPSEIYPTEIRASGHGLAAGVAKLGGVLGAMLIPAVQAIWGIHVALLLLAITLLAGFGLSQLLKRYDLSIVADLQEVDEEIETEYIHEEENDVPESISNFS